MKKEIKKELIGWTLIIFLLLEKIFKLTNAIALFNAVMVGIAYLADPSIQIKMVYTIIGGLLNLLVWMFLYDFCDSLKKEFVKINRKMRRC